MHRLLISVILFCANIGLIFATHNRAGEITYVQISDYTFRFTVTTFTYRYSIVETTYSKSSVSNLTGYGRLELPVSWGDNTSSYAIRQTRDTIAENPTYLRNTYEVEHTFPGPGVYEIIMEDPNRNEGVLNIPNSVWVVFSVKTTILVNTSIGKNNTPVLLNYPIDKAAKGVKFIHNPAAYDSDGDSLSYSIGTCTREGGAAIEGYTLPRASDSLYINSLTGDLVWDAPMDTGIFNIAINIEEWRNGIKIGNVVRDMQIEVYNTKNNPPVNQNIHNLCVEAGKKAVSTVYATDSDNDYITQTASGGPFSLNNSSVSFTTVSQTAGFTVSRFEWQTTCNNVRKQPYYVVVKAQDKNKSVKLTDIDNFSVAVIAPAPENLTATPTNNSIYLSWSPETCTNATGYEIYRKEDSASIYTDSCLSGINTNSGFTKIATLNSYSDTSYTDNNNGDGLNQGTNYCYKIVAVFSDGAQSYASSGACASLLPGFPLLTSANVTKIDSVNGTVFVSWIKPNKDSISASGPYLYKIYRNNQFNSTNFELLDSIESSNLEDTSYTDYGLNTYLFPFNYKVELYNNAPGNIYLIGNAENASTAVPVFDADDNQLTISFQKNIPWLNYQYILYKFNNTTLQFDSIGNTLNGKYTDSNLENGKKYTYKALSLGYRKYGNHTYYTKNWTHQNSGIPKDITAPCAPVLTLASSCDSFLNLLKWTNPNHSCCNDVVKYNIYYTASTSGNYTLLTTITDCNDTTYKHYPQTSLSACYAITAVDSFGNESAKSNIECFDGCSGYSLPNVFTPGGDNINDVFLSTNPNNYVSHVNMKIYNRWGKIIYETIDPSIKWDGKDKDTKQYVTSGVYYYVCDISEPALSGYRIKTLTGFIHVYYSTQIKTYKE
jgi:gliding motility-associated-like protein